MPGLTVTKDSYPYVTLAPNPNPPKRRTSDFRYVGAKDQFYDIYEDCRGRITLVERRNRDGVLLKPGERIANSVTREI